MSSMPTSPISNRSETTKSPSWSQLWRYYYTQFLLTALTKLLGRLLVQYTQMKPLQDSMKPQVAGCHRCVSKQSSATWTWISGSSYGQQQLFSRRRHARYRPLQQTQFPVPGIATQLMNKQEGIANTPKHKIWRVKYQGQAILGESCRMATVREYSLVKKKPPFSDSFTMLSVSRKSDLYQQSKTSPPSCCRSSEMSPLIHWSEITYSENRLYSVTWIIIGQVAQSYG